MNDTILMDENSERYLLNLLLKSILNNTMLVQCYNFINCIINNYLKYGFDIASHINLNYVISDILITTFALNEDVSKKIKLKKCRVIFDSSKKVEEIRFFYPSRKKSTIILLRSLQWNMIIPCKLQMITECGQIFNSEFDFIVAPCVTTTIENIDYSSIGKYILKTNGKLQNDSVKTTSHYKTTYTGYCRFDLSYKPDTNTKLFNKLDGNRLLINNLLSAIKVCLKNEIGNFLFRHIFSHLISSEEQEEILNKLKNDPVSGSKSLRSPNFDIKWQSIIYQKPFYSKIHYNNINVFTSIWYEVYQTYLKFNNMLTVNHERLDEIRKIVEFKDDLDITNSFPDDGDTNDLNVRIDPFGISYRDNSARLPFPHSTHFNQMSLQPFIPPTVVMKNVVNSLPQMTPTIIRKIKK